MVRKHETAKQRVDNVNVGGGVSLWPDMECMRLNSQEVVQLAVLCVGLALGVTLIFAFLHGKFDFVHEKELDIHVFISSPEPKAHR